MLVATNKRHLTTRALWIMAVSLMMGFTAAAARASEQDSGDAREWLAKLGPAMEQTSYRGVFVYVRGDEVNAMRIIHRFQNGMVMERLTQLDGDNGEILRRGGEVICFLPNRGRFELDAVIPTGPFAGVLTERLEPLSRWYDPKMLEDGRVAGFEAVVIAVEAKDRHRYSYRLWLEHETGLLIKSQVRDVDGEILERFQFTQLEITDDIADSELTVPVSGRQIRKVPEAEPEPAGDDREETAGKRNWRLEWTPDGFMSVPVAEGDHHRKAAFTDGMASFSVFVEPLGETDMPVGASRIGATTAYVHKLHLDGQVYLVTVVGEIPPATAMRVAESVSLASKAAETGDD